MFWYKKEAKRGNKPDPFSFQTLNDDERDAVIRCFRDEIKEYIETCNEVEGMFDGLCWQGNILTDWIKLSVDVSVPLPLVRGVIRGVRAR